MMLAYQRLPEIAAAPPRWLRRRCASASLRPWMPDLGRRETAPDASEMLEFLTADLLAGAAFRREAAIRRAVPP
jgi:hypothetical protein